MKLHEVDEEVDISTLDPSTIREAIPTRWVHREKGLLVRSRIVAKGYKGYCKKVDDEDSVYASTPMFAILYGHTLLLLKGMARLHSTSPTRTTLQTTKVRTQRLHFAYKRLLHHGVR